MLRFVFLPRVLLHAVFHFIFRHLDLGDVNLILGGIDIGFNGDVMSFMTLQGIWIADHPNFVVFITHEHLPVITDLA